MNGPQPAGSRSCSQGILPSRSFTPSQQSQGVPASSVTFSMPIRLTPLPNNGHQICPFSSAKTQFFKCVN